MKAAAWRRGVIALALVLQACGRGARTAGDLLPEAVGVWRRSNLHEAPGTGTEIIPAASVRRVLTAAYAGPGKLEVAIYDLTSPAAALDAVQRWKPAADTVFFYRDQLFVVVRYQTADRSAINAFVRDLDKHLAAPARAGA